MLLLINGWKDEETENKIKILNYPDTEIGILIKNILNHKLKFTSCNILDFFLRPALSERGGITEH